MIEAYNEYLKTHNGTPPFELMPDLRNAPKELLAELNRRNLTLAALSNTFDGGSDMGIFFVTSLPPQTEPTVTDGTGVTRTKRIYTLEGVKRCDSDGSCEIRDWQVDDDEGNTVRDPSTLGLWPISGGPLNLSLLGFLTRYLVRLNPNAFAAESPGGEYVTADLGRLMNDATPELRTVFDALFETVDWEPYHTRVRQDVFGPGVLSIDRSGVVRFIIETQETVTNPTTPPAPEVSNPDLTPSVTTAPATNPNERKLELCLVGTFLGPENSSQPK